MRFSPSFINSDVDEVEPINNKGVYILNRLIVNLIKKLSNLFSRKPGSRYGKTWLVNELQF